MTFSMWGLKIKKEETGTNQDLYDEEVEEVRFDVKGRSNTDKVDQDQKSTSVGNWWPDQLD